MLNSFFSNKLFFEQRETLFRNLIFGIWHQLSDVKLAQCFYRDLLHRKLYQLELGGEAHKALTLGHFRKQLAE